MARGTLTHKPPIKYRVQDKNGTITNNAALGVAIGFARHFIFIENRRLLQSGRREKLPKKKYTFAMPKKGIVRIEIESHPKWGWSVRIIGGEAFGGAFLWYPWDDDRSLSQFATYNSIQQVATAEALGGPYNVRQEPDYEAGIIDWKGPLVTEDSQGNELDPPLRNVITWEGPRHRYYGRDTAFEGPGGSSDKIFAWKDGRKYLRIPDTWFLGSSDARKYAGTPDPENDDKVEPPRFVGQPARVSGICAAAVQTQGAESRDVIIIEDLRRDGAGPQGTGQITFYAFWRPANVGLTTNGVFREAVNGDDPNKWHLIGGPMDGPSDFVEARWFTNFRTWYFNESGTEAGAMITVNTYGDYAPVPSIIPVLSGGDGVTTGNVSAANFPYVLQEATINVDAFAETASISYGPRSAPAPTGTRAIGAENKSASGTLTTLCDAVTVVGNITETASRSSSYSYSGATSWNVAVDYKGDQRVYATMNASGSMAWTEGYTASHSGTAGSNGSMYVTQTINGVASLSFGATELRLIDYRSDISGSDSSFTGTFNSGGAGGRVASGYPLISRASAHVGWMDLRNDLAVWSYLGKGAGTTSAAGGQFYSSASGFAFEEGPRLSRGRHRTLWNGPGAYIEHSRQATAAIEIRQGGAVLSSYEITVEDTERLYNAIVEVDGVVWFGVFTDGAECDDEDVPDNERDFSVDSIVPGDPGETSSIDAPGPPSLESLNHGSEGNALWPPRTTYAGTDGTGNIAVSVYTWHDDTEALGVAFGPSTITFSPPHPEPEWLNFITGDDLVDVMNSITGVDPGPDEEFGTPDDIEQPPLDPAKNPHAYFIRVLG